MTRRSRRVQRRGPRRDATTTARRSGARRSSAVLFSPRWSRLWRLSRLFCDSVRSSDVRCPGMVPGGIGVPCGRQRGPGAGDARTDRPDRHFQNVGDLVVGEITDITEHHGGAKIEGQRPKGGVDVHAGGDDVGRVSTTTDTTETTETTETTDRAGTSNPSAITSATDVPRLTTALGMIGAPRWRDHEQARGTEARGNLVGDVPDVSNETGHGPSAATADLVDAGIGGDAVDPRGERAPPVEPVESPDRRDQRVLRCVESVGFVSEHPATERVDAVVVRGDQGLEGLAVSPASRVENLLLAIPSRTAVVVDATEANGLLPWVEVRAPPRRSPTARNSTEQDGAQQSSPELRRRRCGGWRGCRRSPARWRRPRRGWRGRWRAP